MSQPASGIRSSRLRRLWRRLLIAIQGGVLVPQLARKMLLRGAGVSFGQHAVVAHGVFFGGGEVFLGRHVAINYGGFVDGSAPVRIGDYTRVGPFVRILTGTHAYRQSVVRRWPYDPTLPGPVTVERGCWVGIGATILPNITIREGCVIGASAVVVRDTQPNGLYVGNPARRVKDLPVDDVEVGEQNMVDL